MMISNFKRLSRSLTTVLLMGTVYLMLCFAAVMNLLPSESKEDHRNQPSKIQAAQLEAWHASAKRGGRPRNIFSSGGREGVVNQSAKAEVRVFPDVGVLNTPTTAENNFRPTELSDVFIGVKTTEKYHDTRLPVLFETWLDSFNVRKQTYFFTDADSAKYSIETGGHFINTHCAAQHTGNGLCCKMDAIISTYLRSGKRWWCNVDDDNYLNIESLLKLLRGYHHEKDNYLGRSSTSTEITVYDSSDKRSPDQSEPLKTKPERRKATFWFATGGAGVCISRSLALKMSPYAGNGRFLNICSRINLPDDVSIGFLIVDLLGVPLTKIGDMHSHLIMLRSLNENQIRRAVTLSYKDYGTVMNTVTLKNGAFNTTVDPTRFKSLHCMLHPKASVCATL